MTELRTRDDVLVAHDTFVTGRDQIEVSTADVCSCPSLPESRLAGIVGMLLLS